MIMRGKVFELRPHHLGVIYNFVAEKGVPVDNIFQKVDDFVKVAYRESNYPETTKITVKFILEDFIFDKECSVKIVSGLDEICKSGCIQKSQDFLREIHAEGSRYLAKATQAKIDDLCENNLPTEDFCVPSAYELELGKQYSRKEVLNKTLYLINKHNLKNWRDLLPLYFIQKLRHLLL